VSFDAIAIGATIFVVVLLIWKKLHVVEVQVNAHEARLGKMRDEIREINRLFVVSLCAKPNAEKGELNDPLFSDREVSGQLPQVEKKSSRKRDGESAGPGAALNDGTDAAPSAAKVPSEESEASRLH
jgi:hypothetical protein